MKQWLKIWLARCVPDCKIIVPKLGESLDRALSVREKIAIKLHLLTCLACTRYLKQVKFLHNALRNHNEQLILENMSSDIKLNPSAKTRIKNSLKSLKMF